MPDGGSAADDPQESVKMKGRAWRADEPSPAFVQSELLLEAAESCPAVAISIVDQESGETVYP